MRLQEDSLPSPNSYSLEDLHVPKRCARKRDCGEITLPPFLDTLQVTQTYHGLCLPFLPPSHPFAFKGFLLCFREEEAQWPLNVLSQSLKDKYTGDLHSWKGKAMCPERRKALQGHILTGAHYRLFLMFMTKSSHQATPFPPWWRWGGPPLPWNGQNKVRNGLICKVPGTKVTIKE